MRSKGTGICPECQRGREEGVDGITELMEFQEESEAMELRGK
jgi:hypothetical protein